MYKIKALCELIFSALQLSYLFLLIHLHFTSTVYAACIVTYMYFKMPGEMLSVADLIVV